MSYFRTQTSGVAKSTCKWLISHNHDFTLHVVEGLWLRVRDSPKLSYELHKLLFQLSVTEIVFLNSVAKSKTFDNVHT